MEERVGLTSFLLGQLTLEESVRPVPGISASACSRPGRSPPNPAELLNSGRARDLVRVAAGSASTSS